MEEKKVILARPTLTQREVDMLAHILRHLSDYVCGDDRPDHGWGILKRYKELDHDDKIELYQLNGKINRLRRRLWKR